MTSSIGVFDSGIGGLSVVKHLFKQLPRESVVYFGDTARVPYGTRSIETIRRYALECTQFLMSYHVKYIVVACNTVSSVAMEDIRGLFGKPVIGMIEPGVRAAVNATRNGRIAVIGTKATIASESYKKAIHSINPELQVFSQACPLFVPLVEEGMLEGSIPESIVRFYLEPLLKENIDTLVLGCTHYPLLKPVIQKAAGDSVRLIDSGEAAAIETKTQLLELGLEIKESALPVHQFFVSDRVANFEKISAAFLGKRLPGIAKVELKELPVLK
jgi:glutamate racemase